MMGCYIDECICSCSNTNKKLSNKIIVLSYFLNIAFKVFNHFHLLYPSNGYQHAELAQLFSALEENFISSKHEIWGEKRLQEELRKLYHGV